jgi:hypothetical protein
MPRARCTLASRPLVRRDKLPAKEAPAYRDALLADIVYLALEH